VRVKELSARNIKGFEGLFAFTPGDVNVASGKNGSCKTSWLSLVTGLFGKASPRMLRPGAEDGEIRAVIEDGDGGETWEIVRAFLPGEVKTPAVKSSATGRLGAPARFLTAYFTGRACWFARYIRTVL